MALIRVRVGFEELLVRGPDGLERTGVDPRNEQLEGLGIHVRQDNGQGVALVELSIGTNALYEVADRVDELVSVDVEFGLVVLGSHCELDDRVVREPSSVSR